MIRPDANAALTFTRQQELKSDWESRIHPDYMTRLARNSVHALRATNWKIVSTEFGYAETLLPLNHETTNQHGTHQAAIIALSADYTGGMALTTVLTGIPLAGIHPCHPETSASLWLVGLKMRYLKPSTGHLYGKCRVPSDLISKIRQRYERGKRCLVTLEINFFSNGEQVASGEGRYFLQSTRSLQEAGEGGLSTHAAQKLKASARMIAGIRARLSREYRSATYANPESRTTDSLQRGDGRRHRVDPPNVCFDDLAAGPHGRLLAQELSKKLPQLGQFVRARTESVDQVIRCHGDLEQLVLVGAGLDMRPYRLRLEPGIRIFELDLPEMLSERDRVVESGRLHGANRYCIPADFTRQNIGEQLLKNGFVPSAKTIAVYEGCSMYFDEQDNQSILSSLREVLGHPESIVWCDFVDQAVLDRSSAYPEANAFFSAMERLGEEFVFGVRDPTAWLSNMGFSNVRTETAQEHLKRQGGRAESSLFQLYHLCYMTPGSRP